MWANAKNERKRTRDWGAGCCSMGWGVRRGKGNVGVTARKTANTSIGQNSRDCGISYTKSTSFAFPDFAHERK